MISVSTYKKGIWAEWMAAFFLSLKGYQVLERRYRGKTGEIDLIARRKNTIVFIEVKARNSLKEGLEAVQKKAQTRITRTASIYLQKKPRFKNYDCRFDVIVIRFGFLPCHYKNCWII